MRLRFLTATPLDVAAGSGTFVGIRSLADAVSAAGAHVSIESPRVHLPVFTLERLLFNEGLRFTPGDCDVTVGFDMDGYRVAGRGRVPHVASIKGVIADEMRFESGMTRATLGVQARCEAVHARRADMVMTTSRYMAGRIAELYGVRAEISIVPELIDLARWRDRLARHPAAPETGKFTVFSTCHHYPRKRLDVLLRAAAQLRECIPGLRVRIAGDGPQRRRLRRLWRELRLERTVEWLGFVSAGQLAVEYNRADLFCLPSVQEGFGIVFLEAMAARKPIVAVRAAAIPEVVEAGVLVEPDNAEALAEGLASLHANKGLGDSLAERGASIVARYDAPLVARRFLAELARFAP